MEIERIIFSFFKAKGYRSSEGALKGELKSLLKLDPAQLSTLSICLPAMNELFKSIHDLNQDEAYFITFELLKIWINSSPEFCKTDLRKVLGPIFIYTYLAMAKREMWDSCEKFFKENSTNHSDQSDLDKLLKIKSPESDLGKFKEKYPVNLKRYSFDQLVHFAETNSLVIILSILNQNLLINLNNNNSEAVIIGEELKIMSSKSQLILEEEKLKRDLRLPMPFIGDIIEKRNWFSDKLSYSDKVLPTIVCHTIRNANEALCIALSEDNLKIAVGFEDSIIRIFKVGVSKLGITLIGHSGAVYSLSIAPRCDLLISGSEDCNIRLWCLNTYSCLAVYSFHTLPVWNVSFAPLGFYFSSGSNDKSINIWSTENIMPLRMFVGHLSDVLHTCFHPKCPYLASASSDNTVRIWEIFSGECCRVFTGHTCPVNYCIFIKEGKQLVSGDEGGDIIAWDINKKYQLWKVELVGGINSLCICQNDYSILVACDNKEVIAMNSNGKVLSVFKSKIEAYVVGFSLGNLGIAVGVARIPF